MLRNSNRGLDGALVELNSLSARNNLGEPGMPGGMPGDMDANWQGEQRSRDDPNLNAFDLPPNLPPNFTAATAGTPGQRLPQQNNPGAQMPGNAESGQAVSNQ